MTAAFPRSIDNPTVRSEVLARIAAGPLVVGLDFDGTLSSIVDRPQDAGLDAAMRGRLVRLAALTPTAIVSGRDIADLRTRVPVPGLTLVGSHGLEIAFPGGTVERAAGLERSDAELGDLVDLLGRSTEMLPGVLVEPKRHSVAVHWRLAGAADQAAAERIVEQTDLGAPAFRISHGKMVAEFRPAIDRDKGEAVRLLRDRHTTDAQAPAVLYIGDDVTDEDAFRVLDPAVDIGVLVATPARSSAAQWRLPDIEAVGKFLEGLIAIRGG